MCVCVCACVSVSEHVCVHACMGARACVCVFVSILHIVMLEVFVDVYILLAFVQLWITFSISMYIMCVLLCFFSTLSCQVGTLQISIIIIKVNDVFLL